ncbi:MAG: hypothetical protein LBQ33_00995 [Oscillospiraceae bacterium]|jgi:uncharacterized Zn finger protein|nr:hypothetical protein [Oscillospiraceae bacterium]
MGWGYDYYSTPSVAQRKKQAEKRLAKLRKKHPDIAPISIEGNKIAKTWWGVSWCKNLERYADYENRIGRGRSYVKNGLVLDLKIAEGLITAMVSGSEVYAITIKIDKLPARKWKIISELCAKRIDSLAALAEGNFPEEFAEIFMKQGDGLFPSPKEIHMDCDCPDWASMCKHIAAALYGVGAKLDTDPLLFFSLRGIDPSELIKKSVDEKMKSLLANAHKKSKRVIGDTDAARIFGV